MNTADFRGHWALVTGASSGIGSEYALQLAAAGINLVLVARRLDKLDALATELGKRHEIQVLTLARDLSQPGAADMVQNEVEAEDVRIRLLINNAAFGRWGRFENGDVQEYERMFILGCAAPAALCRVFFHHLRGFDGSAVINVSSPAALQPVPFMAAYAASKTALHHFSLALHEEWKRYGVLVQSFLPAPTDTEFDTKAGAYSSALVGRRPPADAVRTSLIGLERGEPMVSSAKGLWKQRFFNGLFPPRLVLREVAKMFKPPNEK